MKLNKEIQKMNVTKKTVLTLILGIVTSSLIAQNTDTVYILYKPNHAMSNFIGAGAKHVKDPDKRTHYPFDGGGIYRFEKHYKRNFLFSYKSYTPEWMDYQFHYEIVDVDSIFNKHNFKDIEWFKNTDYSEVLKTFQGENKVIYLLDERFFKNGKAYLIKVGFYSSRDE